MILPFSPPLPDQMLHLLKRRKPVKDFLQGVLNRFLIPDHLLYVLDVIPPGFVRMAGDLVDVVAGVARQAKNLLELRQLKAEHIAFKEHLPHERFPVFDARLLNLLFKQGILLRCQPQKAGYASFSLRHVISPALPFSPQAAWAAQAYAPADPSPICTADSASLLWPCG